ncbi:hypothetical protein POSPLADRAFT_1048720 [Postia placenta MAD-698-R-SB12]|uniref:GPI inositol-deacylase n=1 Tax=Postia placenta MAD-698-R-SB12 TaxID=670580 RepID=A0A1X6MSL7_9APHY|nr:hypothetical protein POSPLADRAFT_1048720 [Postia placenta MAD-698-R-SB12]OSX59394.1 hypothetical protein POSPLADRAFT_1048720 [Postia placenta MAD-698-R-SB12]
MQRLLLPTLGLVSLLSVFVFYRAGLDISTSLSPQGCRMSWMSPSYVLQSGLNRTWTPLASRYSLYLYREVGWDPVHELHGAPVLFIPGNAGSSHQVRSIASSAARQYFSSPYHVAEEFAQGRHSALDFFALEFNEDLSAFHGPTLDAETSYARAAIEYIFSLYPEQRSMTILAHSMGGVVATALLAHPNVTALVTMSTPHTLPPARLDRRIDKIYRSNQQVLQSDPTPILSLCGGATDLQVPAESCVLDDRRLELGDGSPYRRTVFTSALEGAWSGVGHREMVWCHQVRWRIARAALALADAPSRAERERALDTWLRDGHLLPPSSGALPMPGPGELHLDALDEADVEFLEPLGSFVLAKPTRRRTYLLPIPSAASSFDEFADFEIAAYGSGRPALTLGFYLCLSSSATVRPKSCTPLELTTNRRLPAPVPGAPFPVPDEGVDESEYVYAYGAKITDDGETAVRYVAVDVNPSHGEGWVTGGLVPLTPVVGDVWGTPEVELPKALRTEISFPGLLSHALIVYRLQPILQDASSCSDALMPPLLQHTSHPSEAHYFPLLPGRPILLHSHASGPFLPQVRRGFNLTIHSSNDRGCGVKAIKISVDWWATLGRWGPRYAQAALAWGIGLCGLAMYYALATGEHIPEAIPSVEQSLVRIARDLLPRLLVLSFFGSCLPFPLTTWLGNKDESAFAILAPILGVMVFGLVYLVWLVLGMSVNAVAWLVRRTGGARRDDAASRRNALLSMGLVFLLIFVFVPWQVAFLSAWIYHFYTCAAYSASCDPSALSGNRAIPLLPRRPAPPPPPARESNLDKERTTLLSHHLHALLLMTWLLPIAAPVLAVWVRTASGAGFQAVWASESGWGADRNVLFVAPWLLFVEWAGAGGGMLGNTGWSRFSPALAMGLLPPIAVFFGSRAPYIAFEVASGVMFLIMLGGIGPRYWGGKGWFHR